MITPYPYQTDCLRAIERVRAHGETRALVIMASGLGKTVTVGLDSLFFRKNNKDGRGLYLCHQNEILTQARNTFEAIHGHSGAFGFFNGTEEETTHTVPFLFASLQMMREHKQRFRPDEFDYIVVDESHHTYADTYLDAVRYWRPRFLLGVTATPDRTDGQNIREVFGKEIFFLPLDEALVQGLLTPVDYRLLSDEIQIKKVLEAAHGRGVSVSRLNRSIFVPRRDEEIVKIIRKNISEFDDPRVIVFCPSVAYCEHLAKLIEGAMPIHSKVPLRERIVRLELFRQGMVSTILTVDLFNEGIDIPRANVLVFLRSTASPLLFLQQLGRGLRKTDGKEKVIALDFAGNCERIKMVYNLWEMVRNKGSKTPSAKQPGRERKCFSGSEPMTLNVDSVAFRETIIKIVEILDRTFYATWQEAGEAAGALGIGSKEEYEKKYRADPRLPSHPGLNYADFPGWILFLGKEEKDYYETWQEASAAAIKLGIRISTNYTKERKKNKRLPSAPDVYYQDFPGWSAFLGKRDRRHYYPSWKTASRASRKIGIKTISEYKKLHNKDSMLPAAPDWVYDDFPGWRVFLTGVMPYERWEDARKACIKLGILSSSEYLKSEKRKRDPRLPAHPERAEGFPGWDVFLGRA